MESKDFNYFYAQLKDKFSLTKEELVSIIQEDVRPDDEFFDEKDFLLSISSALSSALSRIRSALDIFDLSSYVSSLIVKRIEKEGLKDEIYNMQMKIAKLYYQNEASIAEGNEDSLINSINSISKEILEIKKKEADLLKKISLSLSEEDKKENTNKFFG